MKKKCRVVMLPTEKETHLSENELGINYNKDAQKMLYGQHLYLISDDKIKEGDWCYGEDKRPVHKYQYECEERYCKKVIASTDLSLTPNLTTDYGKTIGMFIMPTLSEDFIKAYVKANGEIDEVYVEYEEKADGVIGINTNGGGKAIGITNQRWELKLTDNNEVIILMIEEKMYSRDEVIKLINKAWIQGGKDCMNSTYNGPDKFIKENL